MMNDAEIVRKQLIAVVDKRTTMICLRAAGQIRRVDEPFDTLMGALQAPPFHIHCRSIVVPYVIGMISDLKADANSEIEARPLKQKRFGPDGYEGRLPPPAPGGPGGVPRLPRTGPTPPAAPAVTTSGLPRPNWSATFTSEPVPPVVRYLRTGRALTDAPAAVRAAAADLDAVIEQSAPTAKKITAYRALSHPASVVGDRAATGLVFTDPAYGSLSTSARVASVLTADVLMIITVPAGTKAARLNDVPADAELLLGRGTRYRVTSDRVETVHGRRRRVWRVTVLQ